MRIVRGGLRYMAVFVLAVAVLTGLLAASATIPQTAIQKNVKRSAEFLCEGELFAPVVSGVNGSRIDRYADSILLAIAYQYDGENPLTSVMWSAYYHTDHQNENENLLEAVTENREANQQYLRYWHGSIAFLRPLLLIMPLQQIYIVNAGILAVLTIIFFTMLIKRKAWIPALGMVMGLVFTSSCFVPLSLEYTWTYLLMFVMSIVSIRLALSGRWERLGYCFMLAGILTNYLDFLTTETLTLLVPLLLVTWIRLSQEKNGCGKEAGMPFTFLLKDTACRILAWGAGYIGMWLMKWIMASLILRQNVMPYVTEHITERTVGNAGLPSWHYIVDTILRNLNCLFPFEYGKTGTFVGIAIFLAFLYVGYVYHKKEICKKHIFLYAAIGSMPYVRYLVLLNHSYRHSFFVYRAQLAAILAIVMILGEVVEWKWIIPSVGDGETSVKG